MKDPRQREPYITVESPLRFEGERVKNSRFIADVRPVTDEPEAHAVIDEIRAEMPDANHHCWAYRLRSPERFKSSDDGEPGGSAGRPILAQISGRDLFDVVIVVTRYFGGTKLGVGGLMRAYSGAAAQALDRVTLRTITPKRDLWIDYAYADTTNAEGALRELELSPVTSRYDDRVAVLLQIPDGDWDRVIAGLTEHSGGRIRFLEDPPAGD